MIEFHFTDNKFRNFRDHQLSLNYDDVISLNNKIKKYNSILGQSNKKVLPEEKKQKHHISFRRGLYLNKFKQKGEIIKKADLVTLRPLKGICASQFFRVVGKKTKRNLKPYNPLSLKNFYGN